MRWEKGEAVGIKAKDRGERKKGNLNKLEEVKREEKRQDRDRRGRLVFLSSISPSHPYYFPPPLPLHLHLNNQTGIISVVARGFQVLDCLLFD